MFGAFRAIWMLVSGHGHWAEYRQGKGSGAGFKRHLPFQGDNT